MKKVISIFLFVFLASSLYADTLFIQNKGINLSLDTLKIQNIQGMKNAKVNDYMPWIVALLIGVVSAVINYIIAQKSRNTFELQMKSAEKLALNNIQNSKELALFEFTKTLNSKNRQDWITDVRENISNLISFAKLLNIEFNEDENPDRRKALMEKVTYHRTKLILLLSFKEKKTLHNQLEQEIIALFNLLDNQLLKPKYYESEKSDLNFNFIAKSNDLIEAGRRVLHDEWQSIQEIIKPN